MYYESFPLSFDEGLRLLLGGGGGGRRHPIYYIIISPHFGCKWVKYSILWCQPCQNSFIWTYFPIAYTNKTKLSVLKHFLNMTDFDTYIEKISHLCMIVMS